MPTYTYYEINSGRPIYTKSFGPDDQEPIPDGFGRVSGFLSNSTHFVLNGEVAQRETMSCAIDKTTILADGIDVATISNLPNPSSVTVNGQTVEVTDGTIELTFDLAGDYPVEVTSWPHLDWETTIHAT